MNFCFSKKFGYAFGVYKSVLKLRSNFQSIQIVNMGLLTEGSPLSWEETKALAEHVRRHGVEQFINLYSKLRDRTGDVLKWGDEVCYFFI